MVDDLQLLTGGAGVPVVVALVQILKPVLPDTRWHPLLAVVAGVLWAVAVAAVRGTPLGAAALLGVVFLPPQT